MYGPGVDAVANVGVKDGRIAVITKDKIIGDETIDATGLVVAPGFIDAHFHYTGIFGTKVALRDGVTAREFFTQQSREEMLKKEPTRVVLVYKQYPSP